MDRILGIKDEICIPNKKYKYNCYCIRFAVYFNDICVDCGKTNCFISPNIIGNITYKGNTFSSLWQALHTPLLRTILPAYYKKTGEIKEICIDNIVKKPFGGKKFRENKPFNFSWKVTKEVTVIKVPEYEDIKDQPIFLIHNYLKEREDI